MDQELYNLCEAFFGRAELSYNEWLAAMEELAQRRVKQEVIDWWNKEREKQDKIVEAKRLEEQEL